MSERILEITSGDEKRFFDGTPEEKLERVKEIGVNMPVQVNLLQLKTS